METTSQGIVVKPVDALWTLFKSQPKTVRKAFVKRLQDEGLMSKAKSAEASGKTGLQLAEEDAEQGRVTRWNSVDEMFHTILSK